MEVNLYANHRAGLHYLTLQFNIRAISRVYFRSPPLLYGHERNRLLCPSDFRPYYTNVTLRHPSHPFVVHWSGYS